MLYIMFFSIILLLFILGLLKTKRIKLGCLNLVTGGVKCGKSTLSVFLAFSEHKKRVRRVKFKNAFLRIFGKDLLPLPLLYSNIPLSVPYVPITKDLLLRNKRFVYGSVIYFCEASLTADSQLIRDKFINTELMLFNKLIGHETRGGVLIYDTQSISDLHYSIKRSLSNYIYIHHLRKGLFFNTAYIMESRYSDDNSVVTTIDRDLEDAQLLKKIHIPRKIWKIFDAYCYSVLTDHLIVEDSVVDNVGSLKADNIITFNRDLDIHLNNVHEVKEVNIIEQK